MKDLGSDLFYEELHKEGAFGKIYPENWIMLAIISLYDKVQNGTFQDKTFTEIDIHKALDKTNPTFRQQRQQRRPKEAYNQIIALLQEFYLRRDEERQVYMLKDFAFQFCKRIQEVLMANFKPSIVEKICAELKAKLDIALSNGTLKEEWLDLHFDSFRPKIKEQIDFLDRQVDHSVGQLRSSVSQNETDLLTKLKVIDNELEQLQVKSRELRRSLYNVDYIKEKLSSFSAQVNDTAAADSAYESVLFFSDVKYQLSVIDQRIDRIRPKIRQLFSNLNMPVFNSKMEGFIRFLLEKSTVVTDRGTKKVQLPNGISGKRVKWRKSKFIIVERRINIFPAKAVLRQQYPQSDEKMKATTSVVFERLQMRSNVQELLDEVESYLKSNTEYDVSRNFLKIVQGNEANITMAVNMIHQLIRHYSKTKMVKLEVRKEILIVNKSKDLAIWKMKIVKK